MFRAILRTQWKWTKLVVLLAVLAAFALPQVSMNSSQGALLYPRSFIYGMQTWGVAYAVLAGATGLLLAFQAWSSDHRGRHVYALTLPVARWQYVLMRFVSGMIFLAPVVVALAISAVLATATATIPAGLHAYPLALTLRFAFASLVAYAIFFAISGATARSAAYILGAIGLVIVLEFLTDAAGLNWHIGSHAIDALMVYPGILSVFSGRWMLIDV